MKFFHKYEQFSSHAEIEFKRLAVIKSSVFITARHMAIPSPVRYTLTDCVDMVKLIITFYST